jgi:hypothetical protein
MVCLPGDSRVSNDGRGEPLPYRDLGKLRRSRLIASLSDSLGD